MEKDKDLFLDILENPNLTLEDLVSVGHSAESTRFLDKSAYENSQKVRAKFTDAEGNFKEDEFNRWYDLAAKSYQEITDKDTNMSLLNVTAFNESDITVSPEKRTLNTAPIVSFSPNPDRLSTGIFRIGKTSERDRTQSELAQAEKVLLNPVEAAADPSKAKWGDSPNDSWWGNFFDTQVLAQWDEDGVHIDPVTKQQVQHKKGELKLNDNGTYYYEALDGRDIYGRQVLNKLNTITTDGSFWNQYDFFDSDDIKEKSFVGSVAKNLALVGSMFIPYVGWGIAGASVATQLMGLTGTLGKMLTGSDSPTFSAMEGWAKSFNRQTAKSEYAQQNMLCWENFIDLIGDVTAQLREQRAIFKFAPAIFGKGKYGIESKAFGANTKTLKEAKEAALRAESNSNMTLGSMAKAVGGENPIESLKRANAAKESIISSTADKAVRSYLEDYNKLGEKLARAYMVGITVGDTYGEAKQAGANDFEAAMLTMGYAAAENALLKTELGRWIFPELKGEKAKMSQIIKRALTPDKELSAAGVENSLTASGIKKAKAELIGKRIASMPQDVKNISLNTTDKATKVNWMKKWFNAGKDIFNAQKSVLPGTAGAMFANAIAEGTEEVSEELLKDFSTSCFNIVKAAQGDKDTRMQGFLGTWDWNEALKRYGMSFFGGLVGGGINSAAYDYRQFKDIANMTSDQAMQQLVWMDRNNEMDKFWDQVSKETLGDKYHSTEIDEQGNYKLGDAQNNQDLEVKKAIRSQINLIHNILTANGANIDDEGLIGRIMESLPSIDSKEVLGDFRANALATSVTAGRFLKEYNNLCKAIAIETIELQNLNKQTTDSQKPSDDLAAKIKESQQSLKTLQEAKDILLSGGRTAEFYKDALFETTYGVSESFIAPTEVQFMEMSTGKPYALISESERKDLRDKYANWSKTERAEQIHELASIFYDTASKTSEALKQSSDMYQQIKDNQLQNLQKITQISNDKLSAIIKLAKYGYGEEDPLAAIQQILTNSAMDAPGINANPTGLTIDNQTGNPIINSGSISDVQDQIGNIDESYTKRWQEIVDDVTLTNEQKVPLIAEHYLNTIVSELNKTADDIIKSGYIHPEVKRNLLPVLEQTKNYTDSLFETLSEATIQNPETQDKVADVVDSLNNIVTNLDDKIASIQKLNYTPIAQNLRNFAIGLGTDKTILDLVEGAINKEASYQEAADNIIIDADTAKQFDEAQKLLKLYRASVVAARTDNADFNQIFGYNKTLNELCGRDENWTELAEIDAQTADYALQDINMAINRLEAIRGISDLNQGNKLNVQNFTSANKNFILYNKMSKVLTSLLNEDDDDAKDVKNKWNKDGALDELKATIDSMTNHQSLTGEKLVDRTLGLNTAQKEAIEREQHAMDDAIYNFFQKNQDKLANNEQSIKDLAQFLKVAKLDYYSHNNDILTQSSETIDDSAFTWWLASKAALKSSDFHNVYRKIISDDIAPIPTQELGVYAAVASIYDGNTFKAFSRAMRQYIHDDWKSKSDCVLNDDGSINIDKSKDSEKYAILKERNLDGYLPRTNQNIDEVWFSDLLPAFDNILFIEGIPGSGKSTGVAKSIVKILNYLDPQLSDGSKLLQHRVFVAHSTQKNAEDYAQSLNFKDGSDVQAYGKEELLNFISAEYKNRENPDTGIYEYGPEDVVLGEDGVYHSKWKTRKLPASDVPALMFIDEWSRYTQAEIDLLNRFASENGIHIISSGDMDQLSPKAYYSEDGDIHGDTAVELGVARNITPRVPKLGVSMRAGNGQKVQNLYALLEWKLNPSDSPIPLYYVETDTDLYGDKVFTVADDLKDEQIEEIKKDIDKMVANLTEGEKIGYIYHSTKTKLYNLLNSDTYKDKIDFKNEVAAQGREARYYIVENNRNHQQSGEAYHKSLYTGISRAEQASLVIAPQDNIGKLRVIRPTHQENKLIPDNFTIEGIARFSKQRKALLDTIYANAQEPNLSTLKEITKEEITVTPKKKEQKPKERKKPKNDTIPQGDPTFDPSKAQFPKDSIISNGEVSIKIINIEPGPNGTINYVVDLGNGNVSVAEQTLLDQGYQIQQPVDPNTPTTNQETKGTNEEAEETTEEEDGADEGSATNNDNEEQPPSESTVWDPKDLDNLQRFLQGLAQVGIPEQGGKIRFSLKSLEAVLQVNPGDLGAIMSTMISTQGFTEILPGVYQIPKEFIDETSQINWPVENSEPPVAKYQVGDQFMIDKNAEPYEVVGVAYNDETQEFIYELKRPMGQHAVASTTMKESDLSRYAYTPKDEVIKGDDITQEPETPNNTGTEKEAQQAVENYHDANNKPVRAIQVAPNGDIIFKILGHSWNTNYLGVNFDQNGNPILPQEGEPGGKRIDQANGIIKITKGRISTQEQLRTTIGTIRKAMMFQDTAQLQQTIKGILTELKDQELKLQWAFISKSPNHNRGDGGRFFYDPNYRLDYMIDDEHAEIPTKSISLLIQDGNGNCVLEMPMVTLGSPFTAMYALGELNPENPIYKAYKVSLDSGKKPYLVLEDLIKAINSEPSIKDANGKILPGYKRFTYLCQLWKFTSDGVRLLKGKNGKPFNFKDCVKNLGPQYTKSRVAEIDINSARTHRYDYEGKWNDMIQEASRKDVNYSSIMELAREYDNNFNRIGPKGKPFVLRSDSDAYRTDKQMMDRYLAQLNDPSLPKIVIMELLAAPETSIYEYLEGRSQTLAYHYGNQFSAYRILNNIRILDKELWKELDMSVRNKIAPIIDALNAKAAEMQKNDGESDPAFKSRVYKAQREILDEMDGVHLLSNALFDLTYEYTPGNNGAKSFQPEIATRIQNVCNQAGMTGILYRPVFKKGDPISGYGYLINTGANKYTAEDGKSYRIFSKFDTPIFDMDSIYDQIEDWTKRIKVHNGNIYRFVDQVIGKYEKDLDKEFFLADGKSPKPAEKSANQKLQEKYKSLLEELNIKDYDVLNEIQDETKFLEAIRDKYTETLGNIATVISGQKLVYGQLDQIDVGNKTIPYDLNGAEQISFESNNTQDNSYTLTLKLNNGEQVEIPVEILNDQMNFNFGMPKVETRSDLPSADFDFTSCLEAIQQANTPDQTAMTQQNLNKIYKTIQEGVEAGKSKDEIVQDLLGKFRSPALLKATLKKILGPDIVTKLLEPSNPESIINQEEKPDTCPIIGSLKYL